MKALLSSAHPITHDTDMVFVRRQSQTDGRVSETATTRTGNTPALAIITNPTLAVRERCFDSFLQCQLEFACTSSHELHMVIVSIYGQIFKATYEARITNIENKQYKQS